ncbi:hypothetical protein ACXR0O_24855 [Verrucomicrobiota bacterium sgz303538]
MKAPRASALLGAAAMLFGGWWIWGMLVQPLVKSLTEEKEPLDYLFLFIMMPVLSLPGIFFAYFGFRLTRETTPRNFKGTVAGFAVFAVFWLSAQLKQLSPVQVHEKIETDLFTFVSTLVVIPLYALLTVWLMRKEGIKVNGAKSLIGRGTVLIVALQIWQLGSGLFDAYAPIKQGYTHIHEEPWEFLGFVVPIATAYLFCKFANRMLETGSGEPPTGNHILDQREIRGSV